MRQNLKLALLFLISLVTLAGCLSDLPVVSKDMEKKFRDAFPVIDMNESFQLKVNDHENTFQPNFEIPLIFNNTSPYTIVFNTDSFMKLLMIKGDEWIEVKNEFTYSGLLLISPQGTMLRDTNEATVQPVLDDNTTDSGKKNVLLRILMVGEIAEKDVLTGKFVGAYVDVYVTP